MRRLAGEGRPVRALARRPERLEELDGVEPVQGDLVSGAGLARALAGCTTAYYLVHSMEAAPANGDPFADRDRIAAERFATAAAEAGVERIVYLGGIEPETPPSAHLGSRLEVERILMDAVPGSTALRASIVIGAGSSSFRILVRLVERLRVLPLPAWRASARTGRPSPASRRIRRVPMYPVAPVTSSIASCILSKTRSYRGRALRPWKLRQEEKPPLCGFAPGAGDAARVGCQPCRRRSLPAARTATSSRTCSARSTSTSRARHSARPRAAWRPSASWPSSSAPSAPRPHTRSRSRTPEPLG
jgi:hypothetical protein